MNRSERKKQRCIKAVSESLDILYANEPIDTVHYLSELLVLYATTYLNSGNCRHANAGWMPIQISGRRIITIHGPCSVPISFPKAEVKE